MWAVGLRNGAEGCVGVGDVDLIGVGVRADVAKAKVITGAILSRRTG
jgi:hypothetical protein